MSFEKLHKLPLGYGDLRKFTVFSFGRCDGKLLTNKWLKMRQNSISAGPPRKFQNRPNLIKFSAYGNFGL